MYQVSLAVNQVQSDKCRKKEMVFLNYFMASFSLYTTSPNALRWTWNTYITLFCFVSSLSRTVTGLSGKRCVHIQSVQLLRDKVEKRKSRPHLVMINHETTDHRQRTLISHWSLKGRGSEKNEDQVSTGVTGGRAQNTKLTTTFKIKNIHKLQIHIKYKFILKPTEMSFTEIKWPITQPCSFQLINNNESNPVLYFYPSLNDLISPKPHLPKFFQ